MKGKKKREKSKESHGDVLTKPPQQGGIKVLGK